MNIFNRGELLITLEPERYIRAINILEENSIKYECKTFNTSGSKQGTIQSVGMDKRQCIEYYIYVHKNDYDKAKYLINKT